MKTKRYFLEIENMGNKMLDKIELSQKEFKKQLNYLNKRVIETQNYDEEYKITSSKKQYEYEKVIENVYYFTNCCCDTILNECICKDGYCWNTNKR